MIKCGGIGNQPNNHIEANLIVYQLLYASLRTIKKKLSCYFGIIQDDDELSLLHILNISRMLWVQLQSRLICLLLLTMIWQPTETRLDDDIVVLLIGRKKMQLMKFLTEIGNMTTQMKTAFVFWTKLRKYWCGNQKKYSYYFNKEQTQQ